MLHLIVNHLQQCWIYNFVVTLLDQAGLDYPVVDSPQKQ